MELLGSLIWSNSIESLNDCHLPLTLSQGWLLLAITIPFFIPLKSKFLWYLEQHINKYLDSR